MYTYLVIDDEELIRKGTIKKLSPLQHLITCIGEAQDGQQGIEKIKTLQPDIVILDMQMPTMDGTQLLPYLAQHYPDLPLIVISGYRDFDYIRYALSTKAIDYVLKPFSKEAIQKCMKEAIALLEDNSAMQNQIVTSEEEKETALYEYDIQLLKNLILGYQTETPTISSQKLNFINDTHNVILLTFLFNQTPPDQLIQDWLEENSFGDLALYLPNTNNKQMGFLVLFIPDHSTLTNKQLTSQVTQALVPWMELHNLSVIIGISNTHRDLRQLHTAYQETSVALNQQKLRDTSTFYYHYTHEPDPSIIDWPQQDELLFRIEAGMGTEVARLLEELFLYFETLKDFTLSDVKYYCYFLSDQCRLILNYYLNQQDIKSASTSMQNMVNNIFQLNELKEYYLQFFLNLAEMLKCQSVYAVDDVIEKIRIYIQRNYQKNLTQDYLASLFYLNRSYLSTLFKLRTNQKFIDYLNEVRIQRAKELLKNSERKMYQIAKAVGYDNVKYFFRIFKKKEGITPEQYRLGK